MVIKRVEKPELTEQQAYDLNIPLDCKITGDFLPLMLGALTFLFFAFAELLEWNFSRVSDVRLQYAVHKGECHDFTLRIFSGNAIRNNAEPAFGRLIVRPLFIKAPSGILSPRTISPALKLLFSKCSR